MTDEAEYDGSDAAADQFPGVPIPGPAPASPPRYGPANAAAPADTLSKTCRTDASVDGG